MSGDHKMMIKLAEREQKQLQEEQKSDQNDTEMDEVLDGPKLLGIYFETTRITTLNLVEQYFGVKGYLLLSWKGSKTEHDKYLECKQHANKDLKYKPKFNPLNVLKIYNGDMNDLLFVSYNSIKSGGKYDFSGKTLVGLRYDYINTALYQYNGLFLEDFPLKNFPFDCQDLEMHFGLAPSINEYCLVPSLWQGGQSLGKLALDGHSIDEYEVVDYKFDIHIANELHSNAKVIQRPESVAIFRIKLARKWQIYLWKIGLFMFVTSLCSLLIFAYPNDPDFIHDKFDLLVTLLLTAVAFQFVVASYIPNLSYNTYLDWYVTVSFITIFLIIIAAIAIHIIEPEDENYTLFGYVCATLFTLIQIIFVVVAVYIRRYERRKLKMNYWDFYNEKYEEKKQVNVIFFSGENCFLDKRMKKIICQKYKDIPEGNYRSLE